MAIRDVIFPVPPPFIPVNPEKVDAFQLLTLTDCKSGRMREIISNKGIAAYLESWLPVRAFSTITFQARITRDALTEQFDNWIDSMERRAKQQIAWIRAYEVAPGVNLHVHSCLVAPAPLDTAILQCAWQEVAKPQYKSNLRVEPYSYGLGGLAYTLKNEDVTFSPNIGLFHPHTPDKHARGVYRQRRRIQQARERASRSPV